MSDDELLEYYAKYKDYQAGYMNITLNIRDLVRLVWLVGDENTLNEQEGDESDLY